MLVLKSYLQVHAIGLLFEIFKNPGVVVLVISTFRKPRLKDYEFQTSLGYTAIPCLKKQAKQWWKKNQAFFCTAMISWLKWQGQSNAVGSCCIKQGPGDMRWQWGHGMVVALFTAARGAYERWLSQNRSLLETLWRAPLNTIRQYIVVSWGRCLYNPTGSIFAAKE